MPHAAAHSPAHNSILPPRLTLETQHVPRPAPLSPAPAPTAPPPAPTAPHRYLGGAWLASAPSRTPGSVGRRRSPSLSSPSPQLRRRRLPGFALGLRRQGQRLFLSP
jgi:hypothetical protein